MITPIGFILADILGVDPRPFLVAICFGASASFMTPMGYQTNLIVHLSKLLNLPEVLHIDLNNHYN